MAYLGNPSLVLATQMDLPVANFQYSQDPATTTNPTKLPCSWLNTSTGSLFICTDNTVDANVWIEIGASIEAPAYSGALLHRSTNQVITHGAWNTMQWEFENRDIGGWLDLASNNTRLTVPAGVSYVKVYGGVIFESNSTGYRRMEIYKNGGNTSPAMMQNVPAVLGEATTIIINSPSIAVSENDYFELKVWQTSGVSLDIYSWGYTSFSIEKVF